VDVRSVSISLSIGGKFTMAKLKSNEAEEAVSAFYFISCSLRVCYWYQISKVWIIY
jgi:hypothetical protein